MFFQQNWTNVMNCVSSNSNEQSQKAKDCYLDKNLFSNQMILTEFVLFTTPSIQQHLKLINFYWPKGIQISENKGNWWKVYHHLYKTETVSDLQWEWKAVKSEDFYRKYFLNFDTCRFYENQYFTEQSKAFR